MKNTQILNYFDATCDRCNGTGEFVGYTGRVLGACRDCNGTGTLLGGVVKTGLGGVTFSQVSTKTGRPMKTTLRVPATRLTTMDRFNVGMTVGSGWYQHLTGTDQPGDEIHVYGMTPDGEYTVMFTGGGFGSEPVDAVDFTLALRNTP